MPNATYNTIEKRRLQLDKRLKVIEYTVDNSHSQVLEFIKELKVQVDAKMPVHENINTSASDSVVKKLQVFISGNSKDNIIITRIQDILLTQFDSTLHLLKNDILPGDFIVQKISKSIIDSDLMIIVLTENSINSEWVNAEIQAGLMRYIQNEIKLLPIIIGKNINIPENIRFIQCLIMIDGFNEIEFINAIKLLTENNFKNNL